MEYKAEQQRCGFQALCSGKQPLAERKGKLLVSAPCLPLESPLQRTEYDLLLRRHAKISKSRATHYTSNVEGCVEADRRLFLEFS